MIDFFSSIIQTVDLIWLSISNTFRSFTLFFSVLPQMFSFSSTLISSLPVVLGASMIFCLSIGFVKLILGWGNA